MVIDYMQVLSNVSADAVVAGVLIVAAVMAMIRMTLDFARVVADFFGAR